MLSEHPELSLPLKLLSRKTKNANYKLKNESCGHNLKQCICSSPKQYIVTSHPDELYPVASLEHRELAKKVKGLPRQVHPQITFCDFVTVAMEEIKPRVIVHASLRRVSLKIVMITTKKKF